MHYRISAIGWAAAILLAALTGPGLASPLAQPGKFLATKTIAQDFGTTGDVKKVRSRGGGFSRGGRGFGRGGFGRGGRSFSRGGFGRGGRSFGRHGGFRRHGGFHGHGGFRHHRRHGGYYYGYGLGGYPYYGYPYYGYSSYGYSSGYNPYYAPAATGYQRPYGGSQVRGGSCSRLGSGTQAWARCCSAKYKSFNRRTGRYLAYSGQYRRCR